MCSLFSEREISTQPGRAVHCCTARCRERPIVTILRMPFQMTFTFQLQRTQGSRLAPNLFASYSHTHAHIDTTHEEQNNAHAILFKHPARGLVTRVRGSRRLDFSVLIPHTYTYVAGAHVMLFVERIGVENISPKPPPSQTLENAWCVLKYSHIPQLPRAHTSISICRDVCFIVHQYERTGMSGSGTPTGTENTHARTHTRPKCQTHARIWLRR